MTFTNIEFGVKWKRPKLLVSMSLMKASDDGLRCPVSFVVLGAHQMNCFVRSGKKTRLSSANAKNAAQPRTKPLKLYLFGASNTKIKKKIGVILKLAAKTMKNTNKYRRCFKKQRKPRNNSVDSKIDTFPACKSMRRVE